MGSAAMPDVGGTVCMEPLEDAAAPSKVAEPDRSLGLRPRRGALWNSQGSLRRMQRAHLLRSLSHSPVGISPFGRRHLTLMARQPTHAILVGRLKARPLRVVRGGGGGGRAWSSAACSGAPGW